MCGMRATHKTPLRAHTYMCLLIDTTMLPSVALTFPQSNRGRPIPTENDWIVATLRSQSCDSTLLAFFFLAFCCVVREEKTVKTFVVNSAEKKCFIKRLMFIDFSFMSVLLFCLCSGKRSLRIIICERSEMSEVSF